MQLVFSGEDTGRVLKYDAVTKETTVLVKNIRFPNGLTLSKDGAFFLFCEGSLGRCNSVIPCHSSSFAQLECSLY